MGTRTAARSCGAKQGHATRQAAEEHRQQLIRRRGAAESRIEVYRCKSCSGWHVGHRMPPTGRRRRG